MTYHGYKYHYGKKVYGLSTIAIDGFIASFNELGHDVAPFSMMVLVST